MIYGKKHVSPASRVRPYTRWDACTCKICGEHMSYISREHARRHGFNHVADFIAGGNVLFDAEAPHVL